MKFLVDANLPRALAGWLTTDQDDAFYVDDVLDPPAADDAIWSFAAERNLIVVSKDADFAARAVRDLSVRVVWIRAGNLKLRVLEVWIAARHAGMRQLLEEGERLVELR